LLLVCWLGQRLQECLKQLHKHAPLQNLTNRKALDDYRFSAMRASVAANLQDSLAAADPAAALWTLRAACYRHAAALSADDKQAQVCGDTLAHTAIVAQ
jgi:hypothetical protein